MPASDLFISGEVTDDDSSLSVNSTVPSEQKDEYPLEGILGERVSNGIKEYLVKWEGYPYERCTCILTSPHISQVCTASKV